MPHTGCQREATAQDGPMAGRVAVVTGGSRGIGLGIARRFHERGARVVLCARNADDATAAAQALDPSGGTALGAGVHVSDEDAARALLADVRERWGALDVLVNNAAANPHFGPTHTVDHGRWQKIMEVNLWAPLRWTQLALEEGLGQTRPGSVLMVSSNVAATPGSPSGVYGMSKAALNYLTAQLAVELGPRVRVNGIAPGVVNTRFAGPLIAGGEKVYGRWPLPRFGEPEDVADAAEFLVGEAASWVTGQVLTVDGGALLGGDEFSALEGA
ncbi:SDR family oxidoreductase [Streptomyces hirsutus]|uniref:SDR family oxidoreductase n=1 Tax=Streptomyces hirsutus TaxID=35620 RepID=UPI000BAA1BA2|nr:SDR family oxidoreductase [Streptomyces hirsutus]